MSNSKNKKGRRSAFGVGAAPAMFNPYEPYKPIYVINLTTAKRFVEYDQSVHDIIFEEIIAAIWILWKNYYAWPMSFRGHFQKSVNRQLVNELAENLAKNVMERSIGSDYGLVNMKRAREEIQNSQEEISQIVSLIDIIAKEVNQYHLKNDGLRGDTHT